MSEERDFEVEAKQDGWAPKDEWKGDPEQWKTAEQFVNDGVQITKVLKGKVEKLESRVEELLGSNQKLNEWSQKARDKDKKERAKLVAELQEVKAQAISDSDGAAVIKAEKDIEALQEPAEKPTEDLNPMQKTWLKNNEWYGKDTELTDYAEAIFPILLREGYTGQAYFDEMTKRTKIAYPNKFKNKNREKAATVDSGTETVGGTKGWSDLPPEGKAAYAQFQKDIPGFTKEQYLEEYEWD